MQTPEEDRAGAHVGAADNAPHRGPEAPGVSEEEGMVAGNGSQEQGARQGPVLGDLASASIGDSERDFKEFCLSLPFHRDLDAETACRLLGPLVESLSPEVHREITVTGNVLHILLTAGDPRLLQLSVSSVLKEMTSIFRSLKT